MFARSTRCGVAILALCLAFSVLPAMGYVPALAGTQPCAGRHDVTFATQDDPASQQVVLAVACATSLVRGLTARVPVTVRLVDPASMRSSVTQIMQEDVASQPISGTTIVLQLLGALGPKDDLAVIRGSQYPLNTAAQYDPHTKTLYVRSTAGHFSPLDHAVIAHEYTRALQDGLVGLLPLLYDDPAGLQHDSDALLARQALVEGDALTTMLNYASAYLTKAENLTLNQQLQQGGNPVTDFAHDQVGFPGTQGLAFVRALRDIAAHGVHGDAAQQAAANDIVNRALHDPPTSTYEVLNPTLYLQNLHEPSMSMAPPEVAMESSWVETDSDVLGAFGIADLLGQRLQHTAAQRVVDLATKQWRGDRWVVYQRGAEALLIWHGQFSTPAGAQALVRAITSYTGLRFHTMLAAQAPVNWVAANYAIAVRQRTTEVVLSMGTSKDLFELTKRACAMLGYP